MKRIRRTLRLGARDTAELRAEVGEEFAFHFDMRVAELVRAGMSEDQARAEALRAFGDPAAAESRCLTEDRMKLEQVRRATFLDELRQDLRFGARQLRRDPGFSLIAVLTLALGIGMNAVLFTVIDALFLRALPYAAPEQLVSPMLRENSGGNEVDLERLRERTAGVWELAGWSGWTFTLTGVGEPEVLQGAAVTTNFLDVIGVQPLLGRRFIEADRLETERGLPGLPGRRGAVLSYGLWQRRFAGDRSIVGKTITIAGVAIPVVGVLPSDFGFPERKTEIYIPIEWRGGQPNNGFGMDYFARLAPGVTIERAQSALQNAVQQIRSDVPELRADFGKFAHVVPLRDALVGQFRTPAFILFAAATFVLLIACVNVANLLLTRATSRAKELAVRASLGAGRRRIVRQLLTESVLLAMMAALLGVVLAQVGVRSLVAWLPADAVNFADISVDVRIVAYTVGIALLTVLIFGVAPALSVPLDRSFDELRASGRSATPSAARSRALRALVAAEIALSVVLGIGGALMLQSFAHLRLQRPGFDESHVLTLKVSAPNQRFRENDKRVRLMSDLLERVGSLPGVVSAGAIQILPLGGSNWNPGMYVEGRTYTPNTLPEVDWRVATLGYFETMSIPLIGGRPFDARDRAGAPGVALVNQTLALRVFGGESPIGHRVWTAFEGENNWVTIVGVVGDVKDQSLVGTARPQMYRPHLQFPINPMQLMVRTTGDPSKVAPSVQRIIWSLDRDIAIDGVQPLGRVVGNSVAQPRLLTALLTGFAALAIVLGAVGLFGVIRYMVDRRQQEFGIRTALGARPRDLVALVFGEGLRTVAIGSIIGVLGAALLSGVLASQLYEMKPLQPLTFGGIALLVILTTLLAMVSPARRAGKSSQAKTLREG